MKSNEIIHGTHDLIIEREQRLAAEYWQLLMEYVTMTILFQNCNKMLMLVLVFEVVFAALIQPSQLHVFSCPCIKSCGRNDIDLFRPFRDIFQHKWRLACYGNTSLEKSPRFKHS